MDTLLSVIIPTYNDADKIIRCLDSVLNQANRDYYEVIVVNDGSTDETADILKKYKGDILVLNQKNGGVSSARNNGIAHARGRYLWFVDADDSISSNSIDPGLISVLKKNYDMILFGFKKVVGHQSSIVKNNSNMVLFGDDVRSNFVSIFTTNTLNNPCNKMYRKDLIVKNKIKFNDFAVGEDAMFNYEVAPKIKSLCILNTVKYTYYIEKGTKSKSSYQISRDNWKDATSRILFLEEMFQNLNIDINNGVYNRELVSTVYGAELGLPSSGYLAFKNGLKSMGISTVALKIRTRGLNFNFWVKYLLIKHPKLFFTVNSYSRK